MFDLLKQKFTYRLVLPLLLLLCGLVWLAVLVFPDNKTRVIFCNVGQGDATLITQGFHQMLIDGGPDSSVLNCLSKYMPFFDKKIDVVALTHPENDHFGGLMYVLDKYGVDYFLYTGVGNNSNPAYKGFIENSNYKIQIYKSNLKFNTLNTGDNITFGDLQLKVLWPGREWVEERVLQQTTTNKLLPTTASDVSNKQKAKSNNQLVTTFPLNSFGLVFLVTSHCPQCPNHKLQSFLLMADVDSTIQSELLKANPNISTVDVLKFPHHGSKTGISEAFLQRIAPREAIISVGQNSFGHPSKEAIDLLNRYGVIIKRTDQLGNIVYSL